jgi:ubiquinone biosynthesis protein COQ9
MAGGVNLSITFLSSLIPKYLLVNSHGASIDNLQALALMALPSNLLPSFRELNALSDEIWFLSGDVSVDTSWYTKRVSLSTIYAATELFMTTDQSTEFRDTREFLDRRFRDVQVVGGAMGGLAQWVGFTASAAVNVARSKGVRI